MGVVMAVGVGLGLGLGAGEVLAGVVDAGEVVGADAARAEQLKVLNTKTKITVRAQTFLFVKTTLSLVIRFTIPDIISLPHDQR